MPQDLVGQDALVDALYAVRGSGNTLSRAWQPGATEPGLDLETGYAVGRVVSDRLQRDGYRPIGRKIAFTNRRIWPDYNVDTPLWGYVYDRTVTDADDGAAVLSLTGMTDPKIEPEMVVCLSRDIETPPADPDDLVASLAWVAIGFEIVDCHFPDWGFSPGEVAADYALHAALAVGPRVMIEAGDQKVAQWLRDMTVTLDCDGETVGTGTGRNALDGPLDALAFLVGVLDRQSWAPPLRAGDLITTGTLVAPPRAQPGRRYRVTVSGAPLAGLDLTAR